MVVPPPSQTKDERLPRGVSKVDMSIGRAESARKTRHEKHRTGGNSLLYHNLQFVLTICTGTYIEYQRAFAAESCRQPAELGSFSRFGWNRIKTARTFRSILRKYYCTGVLEVKMENPWIHHLPGELVVGSRNLLRGVDLRRAARQHSVPKAII